MPEILTLLSSVSEPHNQWVIKHLSRVITAMLVMTGRVTMLGLSRWGGAGCSYRTVQRVFYASIEWGQLMWTFFWNKMYCPSETYVLIADKTVVTKAGKHTHGLDRFFSSLHRKPVNGLCFQTLALASVEGNWSCPVDVSQVIRTPEEKAATAERKPKRANVKVKAKQAGQAGEPMSSGKAGRKKGSKNKDKVNVPLSPELVRLKAALQRVLQFAQGYLSLTYMVVDGEYGHNAAAQMARQCNLHLVSKLRSDAALYLPYAGRYAGRGRYAKYGDKLNYAHLPQHGLTHTRCEDHVETRIYQFHAWHPAFPAVLNIVILVKINLKTQACAHVILFSTDLQLAADKIVQLYALRFQIEFNFRDAKQFWGLEDFMNVQPAAVLNAANLSLFMTAVSRRLLRDCRADCPDFGVLDLKAVFRGRRYAEEALKCLPHPPEPFLLSTILIAVTALGRIHAPVFASPSL